jgi:hypothetical protein
MPAPPAGSEAAADDDDALFHPCDDQRPAADGWHARDHDAGHFFIAHVVFATSGLSDASKPAWAVAWNVDDASADKRR